MWLKTSELSHQSGSVQHYSAVLVVVVVVVDVVVVVCLYIFVCFLAGFDPFNILIWLPGSSIDLRVDRG